MSSDSSSKALFILLILQVCWVEINASRQITVTCGSDEESQRGLPGHSGKQGPKGSQGVHGYKGVFLKSIFNLLNRKKKRYRKYKNNFLLVVNKDFNIVVMVYVFVIN